MKGPKFVLRPDGVAIAVDMIRCVNNVTVNDNSISFSVGYKYLDMTIDWIYRYDEYDETRENLKIKVGKIREELLKFMNDGVDVRDVGDRYLKKRSKR